MRQRKIEREKQIPPYEKAIDTLKKLDESQALERGEMKAYYSTLTLAVKRYIDEKIDERALESTTEELIQHLNELKINQSLLIDNKVINDLKDILRRADLIKFAGGGMDKLTAKADRKLIEEDINSIKESIPEPTEEELLKDEAYREEKRRKKKKRTIIVAVVLGFTIGFIGVFTFIGIKGYNAVKDQLLGTPTKELLEGNWVKSEYGFPSITVSTPAVLIRSKEPTKMNFGEQKLEAEVFNYGPLLGDFHVMVFTMPVPSGIDFNLNGTVDGIYNEMEKNGARNIIMKDEEFTTATGQDGVKVFGSAVYKNPLLERDQTKEYLILNLFENGGFEQVTVIYNKGDEYAEEIANRIINSIEFNTEN